MRAFTQLLRELLPEEMPAIDVDESSAWHIDVLGYDKPELCLKYYADEKTRESWRIDFPGNPIPARVVVEFGARRYRFPRSW